MLVACGGVCWAYNLTHKIDSVTQQRIEIDTKKSNSLLIVKPDPFQMDFVPRNEKRQDDVVRLWRDAEAKDVEERAAFLRAARTTVSGQ